MLGTGIASAQENVNPDAAPNALDGSVTVPIDVDQNSFGTPVGQLDSPGFHREISTNELSGAVPTRMAPANPLVRDAQGEVGAAVTSNITRGNTVVGDVVVPIQICGNAVALGGNAYAEGDCTQSAGSTGDVVTDGANDTLAGNVVAIGLALPTQVTGNAVGVLGTAEAHTTASQEASTGGDVHTSGEDGSLSGNIVSGQWAAPVQLTNNAVAGAGIARTDSTADTAAESLGALQTDGDNSTGGGNVVGTPLAPIVGVNGNSVASAGNADSVAANSALADAGSSIGAGDRWVDTSGETATLAGNAVQPQLAGPMSVDDNAVASVGNSHASSSTANDAEAGGIAVTNGEGSSLSGNFADYPIALPVAGGGNAVSAIGNTFAEHENDANAVAGGATYTNGDNSTLSATTANSPTSGAVDLCGIGVGSGGNASADCENTVNSETGGYNGTTGNDSVGSGNIGTVPVVVPAEGFGLAGGAVGNATGNASEDKVVRAGGTPNSNDDNGTVSSNVVSAPTAVGTQVFGEAYGLVGNPNSETDSDTALTAGGPAKATGKHGSASGNIVEVPTSNPAQVFGDSVVGVGNGSSAVDSTLASQAGGDATSDGSEGAIAGNVVSVPEASAPQFFGNAVGAGSNVESDTTNGYSSLAGGDLVTTGDRGSLSGNGVATPVTAPAQVFGDAVTTIANGDSNAVSDTAVVSGGDSTTSGEDASVSGNLVTMPVNAVTGVFGDAVSVAGIANANSDSALVSEAGGTTETDGNGSLAARDVSAPVEAIAQVYNVPVEVLGEATTVATDDTIMTTGDEAGAVRANDAVKGIALPAGVDSLMGAGEVPSLSNLGSLPSPHTLPALPAERSFGGELPIFGGNLGFTPVVQDLAVAPVAPVAQPRSSATPALPALPTSSLSGLRLDPAGDALKPGQTERSFGAPAMAGLDIQSLFGSLEDTAQMPSI